MPIPEQPSAPGNLILTLDEVAEFCVSTPKDGRRSDIYMPSLARRS